MHSHNVPSIFQTTTIGEANGDLNSQMTSNSSGDVFSWHQCPGDGSVGPFVLIVFCHSTLLVFDFTCIAIVEIVQGEDLRHRLQ